MFASTSLTVEVSQLWTLSATCVVVAIICTTYSISISPALWLLALLNTGLATTNNTTKTTPASEKIIDNNDTISPPCEQVLLRAEAANKQIGHENLGPLSREAGFSPINGTLRALPKSHSAWDDLAAQLPHLCKTQTLRATVDKMPLLAADAESLPDIFLPRAACILGIVAHSYIRQEGEFTLTVKYTTHDEVLPACVYVPWEQVCLRLGRKDATMTYVDLVLYNFSTTAKSFKDMTVENSELLIPTVNTRSEQMFYGIMVEMNAKTIAVLHDIIECQRSVLKNDKEDLKQALRDLMPHIEELMNSLYKLSANSSKKGYVDPVVWAQTVANLAIPWLHSSVGFAGTAHPFFHMMDEFIGRFQYNSKLGGEAQKIREYFPLHWRQFLTAVAEVSVESFVTKTNDAELSGLWQSLKNAYVGEQGLLGFHRRKAYGFLIIAFRLGRVSTINGLGQKPAIAMWEEVDKELRKAGVERPGSDTVIDQMPAETAIATTTKSQVYRPHELVQHNNTENGFWFAAKGKIYDATKFMRAHPGGERSIAILSGQVATKELASVAHLSDPKILKLLEKYCVGQLSHRHFDTPLIQDLYAGFVALAYKLAEIEAVYKMTMTFLDSQMTSVDLPQELNAHKARYYYKAKIQLREAHAVALAFNIENVANILAQIQDSKKNVHGRQFDNSAIEQIKSRIELKSEINLDINSIPTWEAANADVVRNSKILATVKEVCSKVLAQIEEYGTDRTSLDANTYDFLVDAIEQMATCTESLGL